MAKLFPVCLRLHSLAPSFKQASRASPGLKSSLSYGLKAKTLQAELKSPQSGEPGRELHAVVFTQAYPRQKNRLPLPTGSRPGQDVEVTALTADNRGRLPAELVERMTELARVLPAHYAKGPWC